ncbi:uncharacterized protein LOC130742964 isoform X2 [Lotus japonicus]|uniref:uncharacterized protein LOC130742964 isoform X2 n=1 Tax=Lotus japonicus TaxID=34305 RepID=UPI002583DE87|nr:uncharacterized protein LOC130742964 isoform X2 [Lotus japonicus]
MRIMRTSSCFLQMNLSRKWRISSKIDPKSDCAERGWVAIYDECVSVLYQVLIFWEPASISGYLTLLNKEHYGSWNF